MTSNGGDEKQPSLSEIEQARYDCRWVLDFGWQKEEKEKKPRKRVSAKAKTAPKVAEKSSKNDDKT